MRVERVEDQVNGAFEQLGRRFGDTKRPTAPELRATYAEWGEDLWRATGGDPSRIPNLSAPGTAIAVRSILEHDQGPVTLDLGCGPNADLTSLLVGRSSEMTVVGIDVGLGLLRLAAVAASAGPGRFLPVVAEAAALPFRPRSISTVVAEEVVEHLEDPRAAILEAQRVLHDGGLMVLTTPNRERPAVRRARAVHCLRGVHLPPETYFDGGHLHEFSWRELEDVMPPYSEIVARLPLFRSRLLQLLRRTPLRHVVLGWASVLVIAVRGPR